MPQRILLIVLGLVLIGVTPTYAKGPPDKATISGPGLAGDVALEQAVFDQFAQIQLADQQRGPIAAPVVGRGYALTISYSDEQGRSKPLWRQTYHVDPQGGPGYVYFEGLEPGWWRDDQQWFVATPQGEQFFATVLADQGVRLTQHLPATGRPSDPIEWLLLCGIGFVLLGTLLHKRSTAGAAP